MTHQEVQSYIRHIESLTKNGKNAIPDLFRVLLTCATQV